MVETLPSSEETDFNLEFYTQKNCQLSARAKYIISDSQGLWAHGQKRNENNKCNNQIKEILAGVVGACNNGCVRAQECREHQEDSQINVSDGIDKVRGYLFTINGKHKTKVPFCNE